MPTRSVVNASEVRAWTLAAHAEGREACGVVLGDTAYLLPNSANGSGHFKVSAEDLKDFFDLYSLESWTGVWHSHPSGAEYPSEDDLAWHPQGLTLIIVTEEAIIGRTVNPETGYEDVWRNPF